MKVFISSTIRGLESFRDAAEDAVRSLEHEVIRAEDFPASPSTPQQACLEGIREADVVLLIISERYGASQESGLSATHEEYREARGTKQVISFLHDGVELEERQQAFAEEVRNWSGGTFGASFQTPDGLRREITRALHRLDLGLARAQAVDPGAALERARSLVVSHRRDSMRSSELVVTVTPTYAQALLRPAELEDDALRRELTRAALFGDWAVFDVGLGTTFNIERGWLTLMQSESSIATNTAGEIRIARLLFTQAGAGRATLPAVVEEDVQENVERSLRFASWLLGRVDPTHRVADVVPVIGLLSPGYAPWRTRREHEESPGAMTIRGTEADVIVHLDPPQRRRAELDLKSGALAEDLTILARREMRAAR